MVTLTDKSTDAQVEAAALQPVGSIIRFNGQYERLAARVKAVLEAQAPTIFMQNITPGSDNFALYGPNCVVLYEADANHPAPLTN